MRASLYLLLIIVADLLFLLYGVDMLSISYTEATLFFEGRGFVPWLTRFFTSLLGQNDLALRLPFILFHIASLPLLYRVSRFYLPKEEDRLLAVGLFVLLPGVLSSALLVNSASIMIFLTLLFLYWYHLGRSRLYLPLLFVILWVDNSSIVLFLGLFAYGLAHRNRKLMMSAGLLFLLGLYLYGFAMHGKPRGYFLDLLGTYSLIFSPLLFLYFFYTMYRIWVKERKDILWYISFTALISSILISFRQRVMIEDFAPFVVISLPLMLSVFLRSYRVRLPELRSVHRATFGLIVTILVVNFLITYFNPILYRFIEDPQKHFAYRYHFAKTLAGTLKAKNISAVKADPRLQKRLLFYGIGEGDTYLLTQTPTPQTVEKVTIRYMNHPVITFFVSKLNK